MSVVVLFQTFLFYLVPLVWGRALLVLRDRKRRKLVHTPADGAMIPLYFGVGTLFLFGWALGCWYGLHVLLGWNFEHIFFPSVWLITGMGLVANIWQWPHQLKNLIRQVGLPVMGVLLISGLSYAIWIHQSAYPLNWDWYQHQTLARLIQHGQFSFVASEISDTFGFNSYPPVFHVLLAVAQYPAHLSPDYVVSFWQVIGYWHVVSVGLVSLLLGLRVTREPWVAGLMALMGVLTFDSMVSLTTFALLPQTLVGIVGTGLLALLAFSDRRRQRFEGWGVVAVLGLPLLHYMVGGILAILILGLMLGQWLSRRWSIQVLVGLVMALMVGAVIFAPRLNLDFLNQGEAAGFRFSWSAKLEGLERSYGYLAYLLVPMGLIYAWEEKRRQQSLRLAVLILFGGVLLVIADMPYVLKFFTLTRYWVNLFMVLGLWLVMRSMKYEGSRVVAAIGVGAIFVGLLMVNVSTWKAGLLYRGTYTHIAEDDMAVARFLAVAGKNERVLVVSDPATQFILEGLSGVDSIGGAYMRRGERENLFAGLQPESAATLVNFARTVSDGIPGPIIKRYVALSGRTFNWQTVEAGDRWSFGYNTWAPVDISAADNNFIDSVLLVPGTKMVFRSSYISLIEVN